MARNAREAFEGVHCPLVTPFEDGGVDHESLAALVEHVREGGVDGLVPCGTTGEFASLDGEEYRAVLETTVEHAGDAPVMAGTADTSVGGTLDLIRTAADVGADAALITLPFFHTANDPAGNAAFVERVADDADLPVYLYNIPSCTGQVIQPSVVASAADHGNVVGLKDSGGDFNYFLELRRRTPEEFQLFQGFDSYLVPGMAFGATGGVNALSNVLPEVYADAYQAMAAGEFERATEIQVEAINPLFQQCVEHGFAPATKAGLAARSVLSSDAVRPPLVELDDGAREEIAGQVADATDAY